MWFLSNYKNTCRNIGLQFYILIIQWYYAKGRKIFSYFSFIYSFSKKLRKIYLNEIPNLNHYVPSNFIISSCRVPPHSPTFTRCEKMKFLSTKEGQKHAFTFSLKYKKRLCDRLLAPTPRFCCVLQCI